MNDKYIGWVPYKAIEGERLAREATYLNDGLSLLDKALRVYPADNKVETPFTVQAGWWKAVLTSHSSTSKTKKL